MTKDQEKELLHTIYTTRLLVFIETAPQSNKYRQIILDAEQFKNLTASLGTPDENVEIELSQRIFSLPDLQQAKGHVQGLRKEVA